MIVLDWCLELANESEERNLIHQFWQISQKDLETVDQFVTRLKNKVKSCEFSAVDDMVRDKFVFSFRDLTVKERLFREDKLTLEKVISMASASEASKEQIKAMAQRSKIKKIRLWMKFDLVTNKSKIIRIDRDQVRVRKKET